MDDKRKSGLSPPEPMADPRLLDEIGHDYARAHGIVPIRRVGALTLVAARDMWARLETIDHLEATVGPVTFVQTDRA